MKKMLTWLLIAAFVVCPAVAQADTTATGRVKEILTYVASGTNYARIQINGYSTYFHVALGTTLGDWHMRVLLSAQAQGLPVTVYGQNAGSAPENVYIVVLTPPTS